MQNSGEVCRNCACFDTRLAGISKLSMLMSLTAAGLSAGVSTSRAPVVAK